MKRLLSIGIILLFIGMSISSSTGFNLEKESNVTTRNGITLYVGCSGPGNYTMIQDAIDNASDRDTVFVYDGSSPYYEHVKVGKSINLIGENKNTTVIDGRKKGDIVKITDDWVNISGFRLINGSTGYYSYTGISITSQNNTIANNIILDCYIGIYLRYSDNNSISKNNISNNEYGIFFSNSNYNKIEENFISNNINATIFVKSNNNIITNNIIKKNYRGMVLGNIYLNDINNNTFSNYCIGLLSWSQNKNIISNNRFFNDGLWIREQAQNTVFNNTVNGKPLIYMENESDEEIVDAGQVILINCNNITVKNQELSNTTIGVHLLKSKNCLIQSNNILSNNRNGIILSQSTNNTVKENNISVSKGNGTSIQRSHYNNIVGNNITLNKEYGIHLTGYSRNNNISGNYISNNQQYGIYFSDGEYNKIDGNVISKNGAGIDLSDRSNIVTHNKIIFNHYHGISAGISTHDIIAYNNISSNGRDGIIISSAYHYNISNNIISSNKEYGLHVYSAINATISNNSFYNDGLFIRSGTYSHNVFNNTVNGKPLIYLYNEADKTISNDVGQVLLIRCNNITIQNQQINNTDIGINLLQSDHCNIINNNISNNSLDGIYLTERNGPVSCSNNTILNNVINSNNIGINLDWCTKDNNIIGNTINFNRETGVQLYCSDKNIITYNNIISNNGKGMDLRASSDNNIIFHNNFINNGQNANDIGRNNIWDNDYPSGGNYWDDYTGKDSNGDGIGDTPYPIPGGDNEDRYPLMKPKNGTYIIPYGPSKGLPGINYTFCVDLPDNPDCEPYFVMWEWGDGDSSGWLGPYKAGVTVCATHSWAEPGEYDIRVGLKDGCGNQYLSFPFTFTIVTPKLEIINISGGLFKVKLTIKNIGDADATNVHWSITLEGGFILTGRNTNGEIPIIPVGGEETISSLLQRFIIGFGQTKIIVESWITDEPPVTSSRGGFVFLFFIKVNPGG